MSIRCNALRDDLHFSEVIFVPIQGSFTSASLDLRQIRYKTIIHFLSLSRLTLEIKLFATLEPLVC